MYVAVPRKDTADL
jgi:Zn-dependent M16 (insulinase) family peptidase